MCVMDVFVFKQKTAYEMRISDWSSDVCSSDLRRQGRGRRRDPGPRLVGRPFERLFAGAAPRGGQGVETRPPRPVRPESFADRRADGADAYDRKSVVLGKSVSVRVDLGCSRIITQKRYKHVKAKPTATKK